MERIKAVPVLSSLPNGLRQDGAVSIALEEGVPVLRASRATQNRVEDLLEKQRSSALTPGEQQELDQYEAIDDYLSYLNRLTRNLHLSPPDSERNRAA